MSTNNPCWQAGRGWKTFPGSRPTIISVDLRVLRNLLGLCFIKMIFSDPQNFEKSNISYRFFKTTPKKFFIHSQLDLPGVWLEPIFSKFSYFNNTLLIWHFYDLPLIHLYYGSPKIKSDTKNYRLLSHIGSTNIKNI